MKNITLDSPEVKSLDLVQENIAKLKALFPELLTEGKDGAAVNVDVLKQLVCDATVTDADEKYGLTWNGKRKSRLEALKTSTGTLRPAKADSVDWDTTKNIMIEGDNLEVLKLLQKSYANQVKLIYIDPPYNTGKDFVYPDDYHDNLRNYQERMGTLGVEQNAETSGRFHTAWLNMIHSRLILAKNLLRHDGVLFISIDDHEVDNLKKVGSEVFGEENFVGLLPVMVNPRGRHLDQYIAKTHEYLVVFVKDSDVEGGIVGMAKEGAMLEEYDKEDSKGKYRELGLRNRNQAFNPITRPKLYYPLYVDPKAKKVSLERDKSFSEEVWPDTSDQIKTCWTWGREKVAKDKELLTAGLADDGTWRVYRKDYMHNEDGEMASTLAKSVWLDKEFNNDYGRKSIKELFGEAVMDFPKSPYLMQRIISIGSGLDDLVLDFFAGSGTTGHAVMAQNTADGGNRRYILVQLPEPLNPEKKEQKVAADFCDKLRKPRNIAELTKERLRRAAKKVKKDNPEFQGDLGFRVFKLDTSNLKAWDPHTTNVHQSLLDAAEHVKPDRTADDLLYELLLKKGLDLAVPMESKTIAGKEVISIGAGVMLVCLAETIDTKTAEPLALGIAEWHQELAPANPKESVVIFRDSAFRGNVTKSNLTEILKQRGLEKVNSI